MPRFAFPSAVLIVLLLNSLLSVGFFFDVPWALPGGGTEKDIPFRAELTSHLTLTAALFEKDISVECSPGLWVETPRFSMKSDIRTFPQNSNSKFYLRTMEYPSPRWESSTSSSTSKPILKHKSPSKDKQYADQYWGHQDLLSFLTSFLYGFFFFYLCFWILCFFLRKCLSVCIVDIKHMKPLSTASWVFWYQVSSTTPAYIAYIERVEWTILIRHNNTWIIPIHVSWLLGFSVPSMLAFRFQPYKVLLQSCLLTLNYLFRITLCPLL